MLYKAKAPGSLMLLSEYAVLNNKTAIVAAVDKFISVSLIPRNDDIIYIHSSLGKLTTNLRQLRPLPPFEFVLTALASKKLLTGCNVIIKSDLPNAIGLGSSAAATVTLLVALNAWLKTPLTKQNLWQEAMNVIRAVQGQGSGADCAASIYGGVIAFRNHPLHVMPLKNRPPIVAIYSGKKLSTKQAINIVNMRRRQQPTFYQDIDEKMNKLALNAISIINTSDWQALGHLLNEGQKLMTTLGVNNKILDSLIKQLREKPSIFGAKISGSGLGDCAIGVGTLSSNIFPKNASDKNIGIKQISLTVTPEGISTNEA
ncbi:mevalonate kinase family protein [Coxiella endosymbiont of Amblyomma nuttalli]|uniref:mevalonate kinase family protein n=1 Tax=Coxiella endosymbiont of Amblyomma nuttalli TaxID=2749996 RepID=UPI001BA52564|nr:mevalonate kinase [Coxiella endosymbiont of Amblyomma nuttalli]QTS83706.1 GHMP kinase family protein [Coxiella endosymbiont of Amblyomma nuttalli]